MKILLSRWDNHLHPFHSLNLVTTNTLFCQSTPFPIKIPLTSLSFTCYKLPLHQQSPLAYTEKTVLRNPLQQIWRVNFRRLKLLLQSVLLTPGSADRLRCSGYCTAQTRHRSTFWAHLPYQSTHTCRKPLFLALIPNWHVLWPLADNAIEYAQGERKIEKTD